MGNVKEPTLRTKLYQATLEPHRQLEEVPLLKAIQQRQISRAQYCRLLERLYGFVKPYEHLTTQLVADCPYQSIRCAKAQRLALDLKDLGYTAGSLHILPSVNAVDQFNSYSAAVAYLYMIEGSTLGSKMLMPLLKQTLNLTPECGLRYFSGYGNSTQLMWRSFCRYLNNLSLSPGEERHMIRIAHLLFLQLQGWLADE